MTAVAASIAPERRGENILDAWKIRAPGVAVRSTRLAARSPPDYALTP